MGCSPPELRDREVLIQVGEALPTVQRAINAAVIPKIEADRVPGDESKTVLVGVDLEWRSVGVAYQRPRSPSIHAPERFLAQYVDDVWVGGKYADVEVIPA